MADTITVTANWATGNLSNSIISRQYDNNRYRVEFTGYPEDGTENLIFYLLVFMRTEENPRGVILPPVQLSSDQWLISNYFTQLSQQIRFQLCVQNEAGTFEAHSPIFKGTIVDSLDHVGEEIDIDTSALFDAYREYINQLIIAAGDVVIDTALDATSENPVQNKAVAAAFTEVNGRLDELENAAIETDDTLTQSGAAADALAVGNALAGLSFSVTVDEYGNATLTRSDLVATSEVSY